LYNPTRKTNQTHNTQVLFDISPTNTNQDNVKYNLAININTQHHPVLTIKNKFTE